MSVTACVYVFESKCGQVNQITGTESRLHFFYSFIYLLNKFIKINK